MKRTLRIAHIKETPEKFVKHSLLLSLYISIGICGAFFLFFSKSFDSRLDAVALLPLVFLLSSFPVFFFMMQTPKGNIRKRQREMDKYVLFTGRYLLVKMESGTPLFNSIIDASKSYGVSGKYFKEILDDIAAGTNIEDALENAREYNSSAYFKKILWQLVASIKTGTDITNALRSTLKVIADDQIIEIKKYAKKLNALMLFYMLIACVVPSLGVTLFLLVASFLELDLSQAFLFAVLFFLAMVQVIFIIMVRSIRPVMEL
ncbi:type II secretion system F family protein [Candidatus Woesearchaeota archaeon]|nr:type II secretion system F family protein [Candidatus Woesearchaeota archaeon]